MQPTVIKTILQDKLLVKDLCYFKKGGTVRLTFDLYPFSYSLPQQLYLPLPVGLSMREQLEIDIHLLNIKVRSKIFL